MGVDSIFIQLDTILEIPQLKLNIIKFLNYPIFEIPLEANPPIGRREFWLCFPRLQITVVQK